MTQVTTAATTATTRASSNNSGASSPPASGDGAVGLSIGPVDTQKFLDRHWDREPLLVSRHEPLRFAGLLSPADVEQLVCTTGIRSPAFRLVRSGEQLPVREYTENIPWRPGSFSETADVGQVAREFEQGATIVLQGLHLHWHPTALYCRALEDELGCPVQANAYLTPAAAQGFAVHHDTHSVLVLQTSGSKRWRVYQPLQELPLKGQRWSPELGEVGEPVLDFDMKAGDTLYLPRGWPHEARASDDDSLHLTVGLHPHTRLDALRAALDSCAEDVEFRRQVAADGGLPEDLLERFADRLSPEQVRDRMRRRLTRSRRPILDRQLSQVRALANLDLHQELERRPTVIADLELTASGATLAFEGREVRFPAQARAAIEAIYAGDRPFTAAALPGPLDAKSRLVLVRRLVREGFLQIVL